MWEPGPSGCCQDAPGTLHHQGAAAAVSSTSSSLLSGMGEWGGRLRCRVGAGRSSISTPYQLNQCWLCDGEGAVFLGRAFQSGRLTGDFARRYVLGFFGGRMSGEPGLLVFDEVSGFFA